MARRPRSARLETRTARLKLPVRKKPHEFTTIAPGIALAYRRNQGAGTWVVRVADGRGGNWTKAFGVADDHEDADGSNVLDFWMATDKARALARGSDDNGRPVTVAEALDRYRDNLKARGGLLGNAERVRYHLPPTIAAKPVSLLTTRELEHWRDSLVGKIKPASVNRLCKGLKAAFNLAAKHDARITNTNAWKIGLAALPDAHNARNVILTDEQVRALIAAAYAEDHALGLLVETAAVTGARVSQLARVEIADLQDDRPDPRLMMPSSKKGRGHKRISRAPVPITASLAALLRQAAGERGRTEPLLLRTNGTPWRPATADYRLPVISAVSRAGLDPKTVTLYSLRHSSIVRGLLHGVPTRVVAAQHDTSVSMLERTYSHHILDHSDTVARRGLLDTAQKTAAAANVVPLAEGR
jgi:integrase